MLVQNGAFRCVGAPYGIDIQNVMRVTVINIDRGDGPEVMRNGVNGHQFIAVSINGKNTSAVLQIIFKLFMLIAG